VIDPQLRARRVTQPQAEPGVVPGQRSNVELLEGCVESLRGKLADKGIRKTTGYVLDAIRYFRVSDQEIPVREWTKEGVWKYVSFVKDNYCAELRNHAKGGVICLRDVWDGRLSGEAAARSCASCKLFRSIEDHYPRLNALNRYFRYLARRGEVSVNFVQDILNEYADERPRAANMIEKKRNPTVQEEVALINGTGHPLRRYLYAVSAKGWMRPNELFLLDRYASYGLPVPAGCGALPGFEHAFRAHPEVPDIEHGGGLFYLANAKGTLDKRRGNRWFVEDGELRPLREACFEWWDRTVKRSASGAPVTTQLVISDRGLPIDPWSGLPSLNSWLRQDTERLGLTTREDREDPRRKWTMGCQRHFGERLRQLNSVPSDWSNHFRGDAFKDARGAYYRPTPLEVREMYLKLVPRLGIRPIPAPTSPE
jgi:hypothetical protein